MSEYHPSKVRRPGLTTRKILNHWPLLVWVAIFLFSLWAYRVGVRFERVNAAVDMITETVVPLEDGIVREIFVRNGDLVKPGDKLAQIDTSKIDDDIERLKLRLKAKLQDNVRDAKQAMFRPSEEMRDLQRREVEDAAELESIIALIARTASIPSAPAGATSTAPSLFGGMVGSTIDLEGKKKRLEASLALYKKQSEQVQAQLDLLQAVVKQADDQQKHADIDNMKATSATDLEDLLELRALLARRELFTIRAATTGYVERNGKTPGEYLKKTEPLLSIVAKAKTITGFLPQDQQALIHDGMTVWVASTQKSQEFFQTTILNISSRISVVPDRSSPLPNKRLRGEEFTVALPEAKDNGGIACSFKAGEAVVIYFNKPKETPFLTKMFGEQRNDL
jgi:multidrug resistance efflux pump